MLGHGQFCGLPRITSMHEACAMAQGVLAVSDCQGVLHTLGVRSELMAACLSSEAAEGANLHGSFRLST